MLFSVMAIRLLSLLVFVSISSSNAFPFHVADTVSDIGTVTQRRLSTIVGGVTGQSSIAAWYVP